MRVDLNNGKASISVKALSKSSRIWVVLYLIIIFSMYVQFWTNYENYISKIALATHSTSAPTKNLNLVACLAIRLGIQAGIGFDYMKNPDDHDE